MTLHDSLLFSSINFDYVMFKSTIFGSDYCWLANNNGCGQYDLIGVRLLFEGGHYNIQGLAAVGYYSRAATIRGRRLIEEIRYLPHIACTWNFK